MTSHWTHAQVNEARVRLRYDVLAIRKPDLLEQHPTDWSDQPAEASDGVTLKLRAEYDRLVLKEAKPLLLVEDIWRYAVGDRAAMSTNELIAQREKDVALVKRFGRLSTFLNSDYTVHWGLEDNVEYEDGPLGGRRPSWKGKGVDRVSIIHLCVVWRLTNRAPIANQEHPTSTSVWKCTNKSSINYRISPKASDLAHQPYKAKKDQDVELQPAGT
jgi:hypothetical protein